MTKEELREYQKRWYASHRQEIIARVVKWRKDNIERQRETEKRSREKNADRNRQRRREIYAADPKKRDKHKRYLEEHSEQRRETKKRYYLSHKEEWVTRRHLHRTLAAHGSEKGDVGCCPAFLRGWLEAQFDTEMTWDNYGKVWCIDHIVPFSWWDVKNHPEHLGNVNHYSNLRPMLIAENLRKSARYAG